jgi:Ni,Fe-hydrogenase III large subunit
MGYTVALNRTGMQYSLYDQQMHDVWSETGNDISRVIMYVDSVTTGVHVNDVNASLSVYPNPSKGIFTIEAKNKANGAMQAEVFNHLGERVYSAMLNESGRIDLSDKPEGVYFVQVKSAAGVLTKKIIVSR